MGLIQNAEMMLRLARWGLVMARHDTSTPSPVPENPKFLSPRAAVARIPDGAVVAASGLGTHQRASILYWAIREAFEQSGRPRGLSLMNIGGHGGRGVVPGTLDELARPGLCRRFITSHFETFRAMQQLAADGHCELQCLPLGIMALLFDALGRGEDSIASDTGVGSFIDPRVGRGSPVTDGADEQLVSVAGERLRYRIPPIDVAIFNLPAADRTGNLYARNAAIVGDSYELARAARANGGTVIANVGLLVDEGYDRIFLPAEMVDAIVYHPETEQTAGFTHRAPWPALTRQSTTPIGDALAQARFVRQLVELTGAMARRTAVDAVVARLAAETLAAHVQTGATVALGAGMPEDVGGVWFEQGRLAEVRFLVESGAVGGLPAPGAYFGAAFSPSAIMSTAELFKRCYRRLDAACLGALEVDAAGNVNVSKRGDGVRNYAGPGGFIDFTAAARTLIFVCGWMRDGAIEVDGGRIRVRTHGAPKFVEHVREVTFNAPRALQAGKRIYYATPVGLFRLTRRGLTLERVLPGIDVRRDVLEVTPVKIALPVSGEVPVAPSSIVTGDGFTLPRAPHIRRVPAPAAGGQRKPRVWSGPAPRRGRARAPAPQRP
jgi:propionate CoA-transferase